MANYFSYSQINQFQNCPRQYKFRYIEKAAVEQPVSVELFLGSAVHSALERLYKYKVNGRIQPEDEMLKLYHETWEGPDKEHIKVTRENLGIDDFIKVGADALQKYYKMYHPFDEGEILGLEKNLNFPIDASDRFILRGKLDKITLRKDGVVEVVDYKTKAGLPTQQSLDNDLQMGLYHLGVRYLWPQFERIELKQIYLRHGVEMTANMNEEKLDELRFQAQNSILEIEQAWSEDNFPTKESGLCDFCVYYELCPAKRHRLALEEEAEVEFDADAGRDMADKYLELTREKKRLESELAALKDEIVKFCEEVDLNRLDAREGHLKVTSTETDAFPTKTEDNRAYVQISQMIRDADLQECFKLDQNVLYKEFFAKKRLPEDLMERLREFLRRKKMSRIDPRYKIDRNSHE